MNYICKRCDKGFGAKPSDERKFCSYACYWTDMKKNWVECFYLKIKKTKGCWIWKGHVSKATGYGLFTNNQSKSSRTKLAHRVIYELEVGIIPAGLHLDHLCRNRACVNPKHLEPVTRRENILRGVGPSALNAKKEYCHRYHSLSGNNVYANPRGERVCRACRRISQKQYRARVEARILS